MSEKKKASGSTDSVRSFWDGVRESAKGVQSGPAWMNAGISLNPVHFNTFAPEHSTDGSAQVAVTEPAKKT